MLNKILILVLCGVFFCLTGFAQTIIPGGNVSGTWMVAGSPYLVQGNITIQADSTLIIEPGVEVIFQANYYLIVNGWLEAVGTETDSIHFSAVTTWAGLAFSNAPDSSHLEYCSISGSSFTGIQSSNSNPVITSCKISNNGGAFHGGIVLENSNARITQCDIINNFGYGQSGGGIYIGANSSPEISYCNITGNSCNNGGGIYVTGSNPMISHCTVSGNNANLGGGISFMGGGHGIITDCFITSDTAEVQGGGIYISSPGGVVNINNSTIYNCNTTTTTSQGGGIYISPADTVSIVSTIIDANYALGSVPPYGGGAIFSGDCNHLVLNHCDVVNNRAGLDEGGIMLYGNTNITVKNSIFRHQQGFHILFQSYTSAAVSYSDFYDSWLSPPFQNPPAGLGTITQVNANGDSCDVFYNIYLDPLFVDANGNYNLTETSPCIDAGDPNSPLDPDGTICDMGAWYFHQSPLIFASDSLLDFGLVDIGQQLDLPLTIRNDGTVALRLQNMSNQNSVFTHDWNPADSLILPGDSLSITVTFTPVDTNLIVDTLLIENNDKPLQVGLSGKGKTVVGIENQSELPKVYALYPAYPNPFNPVTNIRFDIPKSGEVELIVYDILGRKVATLVNKKMSPGRYRVEWGAASYTSGLYFYQLKAGNFIEVRKMLLVK